MQRHVHEQLVEGAVQERRVDRDHRVHPAHRQARRAGHRVLLGDAHVEDPVRAGARERGKPGGVQHRRGDRHHVGPPLPDRGKLVAEHLGPGALGHGAGLPGRGRGWHLVQAVFLVLLGERVAESLAGHHVHDHRPAEVAGAAQQLLDKLLVVAVDRAEVLDPQVLEQHLRLKHVLEALLDAVQRLVQRRADQRRVRQRGLDVLQHVLVPLRGADRGQVGGQAADRRLVGAAVVVDDDDEPGVPGDGDVVQRLPGHPAGERAVADDRHHAARLTAQPVRLGQPVGVGQAGGGVRVLHDVVLGLGLGRVPGQPAALPQRAELRVPPGEQLVHVGLVTGVKDDPVRRRFEDPVQRDGELHHAEVRAEVAAGARHRLDQDVTDLAGQGGELVRGECFQISRACDGFQHPHVNGSLGSAPEAAVPPGAVRGFSRVYFRPSRHRTTGPDVRAPRATPPAPPPRPRVPAPRRQASRACAAPRAPAW